MSNTTVKAETELLNQGSEFSLLDEHLKLQKELKAKNLYV
jgi:hypothetical protein